MRLGSSQFSGLDVPQIKSLCTGCSLPCNPTTGCVCFPRWQGAHLTQLPRGNPPLRYGLMQLEQAEISCSQPYTSRFRIYKDSVRLRPTPSHVLPVLDSTHPPVLDSTHPPHLCPHSSTLSLIPLNLPVFVPTPPPYPVPLAAPLPWIGSLYGQRVPGVHR